MKEITDIRVQTKNKNRVSIYLDGAYYCGLDTYTTVLYKLKIGMQIEECKLIEIQKKAELEKGFEYTINLISKFEKTKKGVKDKLKEKGYLPEIIEEIIMKLENYHYIDDREYARKYVSTYISKKGKRLLVQDLLKKGIDKDIIFEVMDNFEEEDEDILAIAKKYMKNKELNDKEKSKCYRYLLSKGFSYDKAKEVIDKIFED